MKIISWNVNGLRSVYQKGALKIDQMGADILCLQEIKASKEQRKEESPWTEEKEGAQIIVHQKPVGFLGFIDPQILNNFQIKTPLVGFVLDFEALAQEATTAKIYSPLPSFPPVIEDLTFSFPHKTYLGPVITTIKTISSLIKKVEITSAFGNRHTFRLTYQHPRRNLNNNEVKKLREKIIKTLEKKISAQAVVKVSP